MECLQSSCGGKRNPSLWRTSKSFHRCGLYPAFISLNRLVRNQQYISGGRPRALADFADFDRDLCVSNCESWGGSRLTAVFSFLLYEIGIALLRADRIG